MRHITTTQAAALLVAVVSVGALNVILWPMAIDHMSDEMLLLSWIPFLL